MRDVGNSADEKFREHEKRSIRSRTCGGLWMDTEGSKPGLGIKKKATGDYHAEGQAADAVDIRQTVSSRDHMQC